MIFKAWKTGGSIPPRPDAPDDGCSGARPDRPRPAHYEESKSEGGARLDQATAGDPGGDIKED